METHLFAAREPPKLRAFVPVVAICGKVCKLDGFKEFAEALAETDREEDGVCLKCLFSYMKMYRRGALRVFAFNPQK